MRPIIEKLVHDGVSLVDNPYRLGSDAWGALLRDARRMYRNGELTELSVEDYDLLESDAGEVGTYDGKVILLDVPSANFDRPGWFFVYSRTDGVVHRIDFEAIVTTA